MHPVGFIIRIHHEARSSARQILQSTFPEKLSSLQIPCVYGSPSKSVKVISEYPVVIQHKHIYIYKYSYSSSLRADV